MTGLNNDNIRNNADKADIPPETQLLQRQAWTEPETQDVFSLQQPLSDDNLSQIISGNEEIFGSLPIPDNKGMERVLGRTKDLGLIETMPITVGIFTVQPGELGLGHTGGQGGINFTARPILEDGKLGDAVSRTFVPQTGKLHINGSRYPVNPIAVREEQGNLTFSYPDGTKVTRIPSNDGSGGIYNITTREGYEFKLPDDPDQAASLRMISEQTQNAGKKK